MTVANTRKSRKGFRVDGVGFRVELEAFNKGLALSLH